MLEAPILTVEVVKFIEPLTVFAHGVKLQLRYKDTVFTCNYSYSPFLYSGNEANLKELVKEHQVFYETLFYPGKKLCIQAELVETASNHCMEKLSDFERPGLREIDTLDWELIARIEPSAYIEDETVLINCGFPLLAFCKESVKSGDCIKWIGELNVFPAP